MAEPLTLYKLIMLYMMDKVDYPLTNSQISEFILGREYTSYFHMQQALSEMIESNLTDVESIRNTSYYRITDSGKSTLEFFGNEVSPEIKKDIEQFLQDKGYELQEEVSALADYYKSTINDYAVRLQLKERGRHLVDMTLNVPTEEAARAMCLHWEEQCHNIYGTIMESLL